MNVVKEGVHRVGVTKEDAGRECDAGRLSAEAKKGKDKLEN